MPIYHTNQFWNYVTNESLPIINQVKLALTREDYDFEKKVYNTSTYYQKIGSINIDGMTYETLRYPAGLTKYLRSKLPLMLEAKEDTSKKFSRDEVLATCKEIEKVNPKFEVRDYQIDAALTSLNKPFTLIQSTVGSGKEQPCDVVIPTPKGFVKFGSLQVGDEVFGSDGKPQKVIGVFPQGIKDVYRVTFMGGGVVECGLEHLWTVSTKRTTKTLSLKDIMKDYQSKKTNKFKYFVPYVLPVEYEEKAFEIEPEAYARVSVETGSFDTKYLFGSVEQRFELLQAYIDLIGREFDKGYLITTNNPVLLMFIKKLALSLGAAVYTKGNSLTIIFDSDRPTNYIVNIEKIRRANSMCIKVSNPDELYVTQDYVLTHNTSIMSIVCKTLSNHKIFITNGNNFILNQIYERLLSFGETDVSWNPSKEPDYSKRIVLFNTKGSDVRLNQQDENYINFLKQVNTWIIDEASHFQSLTNFEPLFYMDHDKLQHVIGYTATPFRNYKNPYQDAQDFTLIALLGEPAFVYEMKDTISDGNIAQPYGYFINYPNREANLPPQFKDNYYMQYRANITYNKARNKAGLEMLKFLHKNGIKTLASFTTIKPGQNILKELKEEGIDALFICGDETIYEWQRNKRGTLKLEKRKGNTDDIKQALADGYNIVVASQVMDEGVDISTFQAAVLFGAGKSPIKVVQVAGRASRKKEVNNISFLIDFKDVGGHYVFNNQYMQRRDLLKASGVKIIENVYDFLKMVEDIGASNKQ